MDAQKQACNISSLINPAAGYRHPKAATHPVTSFEAGELPSQRDRSEEWPGLQYKLCSWRSAR
ncbi:hypothetical protein N7539_007405 [Penicillium diatomitis]|uniref:Uncharacterized protein n=1 Tax=Penicillium diatomitis TaxID=2819901 RepID=A0A9X0BPA4_9EURO|nr:uncharacterized protein N7539_007405 [Penicillium diatomitis]KAJ5477261.1 hypothetical protein N7539_007405 [Penicillium diatomitis]